MKDKTSKAKEMIDICHDQHPVDYFVVTMLLWSLLFDGY